jgi:phosphoribosylglycinamide formyltransferase-1
MAGRIVVLISGTGSNMLALADACDRGEVPGEVVAVLADRDCEGLSKAAERGLAVDVVRPSDFVSRDEWSEALRDLVAAHRPDLVVSAGFMRILAPAFVDAFAGRLVNLHPALLPAFPGPRAVRDALAAGVKVTGSTVHFVDHLVDHGPIVDQRAVEVAPEDDETSLHDKIKRVEHELLPHACRLLLEGRVRMEGAAAHFDPA